jgi:hypothetical protein
VKSLIVVAAMALFAVTVFRTCVRDAEANRLTTRRHFLSSSVA